MIDDLDRSEFSVAAYYTDGFYRYAGRFLPIENALALSKACVDSGDFDRVIVTDGGDCIVFEWIRGEGITWPDAEGLAARRYGSGMQ